MTGKTTIEIWKNLIVDSDDMYKKILLRKRDDHSKNYKFLVHNKRINPFTKKVEISFHCDIEPEDVGVAIDRVTITGEDEQFSIYFARNRTIYLKRDMIFVLVIDFEDFKPQ